MTYKTSRRRDALGWITHFEEGIALNGLARYKDAIIEFNKAIALNPKWADIHYNKSVVLCNLKKYKEAIMELNKAIKLNPNDVDYRVTKEKVHKFVILQKRA